MNSASLRTRNGLKFSELLKPKRTLGLLLGLVMLLIIGGQSSARADTISYFNFNDFTTPAATAAAFASDGGRAATLSTNFTGGITNMAGTTVGRAPEDVTAAGQALGLQSGTGGVNNGKYLQIDSGTTTGYKGIVITFATQGTSSGFTSNQFQYSTDGTNFTNFNDPFAPPTAYSPLTFDLSGITGIDNNASAAFRIVFSGASSGAGNNRIDNLVVSGTSAAATGTPEPETWAMMGLGLIALTIFQWRRKRAPRFSALPHGVAF